MFGVLGSPASKGSGATRWCPPLVHSQGAAEVPGDTPVLLASCLGSSLRHRFVTSSFLLQGHSLEKLRLLLRAARTTVGSEAPRRGWAVEAQSHPLCRCRWCPAVCTPRSAQQGEASGPVLPPGSAPVLGSPQRSTRSSQESRCGWAGWRQAGQRPCAVATEPSRARGADRQMDRGSDHGAPAAKCLWLTP